MSKKILLYGLAFGSLLGASKYIYFVNAAYTAQNQHIFFMIIEMFVIPVLAVVLCIKSVKQEAGGVLSLGRAVFSGFFTSILISIVLSLVYA